MPETDSLKRLGGGRWETRDGRFAIEPQSGTWVIVDSEQTDDLGLPLVRGPFATLTAAKEAIVAARTEAPRASPLAERIELARRSGRATPKSARSDGQSARVASPAKPAPARPAPAKPAPGRPEPEKPEPPPEPTWLRGLERSEQRRARDLVARLAKMGIKDPERVVRAEVVDGQPAVARLAIERALAKAASASNDSPAPVRAAIKVVLGGADVELGVSWRLVDGQGRRIEKLEPPG